MVLQHGRNRSLGATKPVGPCARNGNLPVPRLCRSISKKPGRTGALPQGLVALIRPASKKLSQAKSRFGSSAIRNVDHSHQLDGKRPLLSCADVWNRNLRQSSERRRFVRVRWRSQGRLSLRVLATRKGVAVSATVVRRVPDRDTLRQPLVPRGQSFIPPL